MILLLQIIFVLSFLVCTITFINGHPNAFSYSESNWTPKTSEDDVRSRSLSHDDLTPSEDIEDFDKEYDFDGVDDDLEDDYLEYKFLTNNKRSPNSVSTSRNFNFREQRWLISVSLVSTMHAGRVVPFCLIVLKFLSSTIPRHRTKTARRLPILIV